MTQRAHRWSRGIPLRVTLVATLLVLVGLGLLASGFAVTSALRSSLISRTDAQLLGAADGWAKPHREFRVIPPESRPGPGRPPTPFFVQIIPTDGSPKQVVNDGSAEPLLPANGDVGPTPVTIGSADDSNARWRAVTTRSTYGIATVAIELTDVDDTVTHLIWLQLLIGSAVLVVLGGLGYLVVRRSLEPLTEVEKTAAAIAEGDLHSRVPEGDSGTEVGRLFKSINGMLTQIQRAFAATEESEAAARRSEEKMRRFITDASHELRTPLTTIRGFAELYRQGAARDTGLLMKRIEGEASRMGILVEDLLMLARLDAQRPLERLPVDLLVLATDAVHDAKAVDPVRTIRLEVVDGPGTPEVLGDDARLRQVLGNLVSNALRYTPVSATVTIRVGTSATEAFLEVADNGPGLSAEDAERVFERFYRADTSRTRESGGTGLGLSIVAALVAAHDGTVTLDSAPGRGATFRVTLPRPHGPGHPDAGSVGPSGSDGADEDGADGDCDAVSGAGQAFS
ncbi:HAMP domain-containing sensor histidine kinase [Speluncibacter jeojiensis]|uniref:sensor histidine kinase n=1 Tax=Speluncibacter jeojiensis TaxID=2710754 RepID=UPI002FC9BF75